MGAIQRLTDRQVQAINKAGRHADGGGLYLSVTKAGNKKWVFLYTLNGKRREMGLGSADARQVTLKDAREAARLARDLVREDIDPIEARASHRAHQITKITFAQAAASYIEAHSPSWRNAKHRAQWEMTMRVYAEPLSNVLVEDIETHQVLAALKPIWTEKAETASRVRNRIELILDAAKAQGHRSGENPARWRGHLDKLLPKRQKLTRGHHAAMPFDDLPAFISTLREKETMSAMALELLILTAARSGEILGARWNEIDLEQKIWTVPAGRMKAGREHRVPLSERSLEVLRVAYALRDADEGFVFTGSKNGKPLSDMSMAMLMRRMEKTEFTVHGFRSAFRDWVSECTNFQTDLAEAALAHVLTNKVEAAYRRGDALERRRELMEAWSQHCCDAEVALSNIVQLKRVN